MTTAVLPSCPFSTCVTPRDFTSHIFRRRTLYIYNANHQLADALSRLPLSDAPGTDIDDSFPVDSSTRTTYRGPRGPVLHGVLLSELGADEVDKPTGKKAAVTANVFFTLGRAADADIERAAMTPATEEHPVAVVLCCGGGGWFYGSERAGCSQGGNRP